MKYKTTYEDYLKHSHYRIRIRGERRCDMCRVLTGTSYQRRPEFNGEWQKIIHKDQDLYEWTGGEIQKVDYEFNGRGDLIAVMNTYEPKKMCTTCYKKYSKIYKG